MTFEEFQATGRDSDDLVKDVGVDEEMVPTNKGRVYCEDKSCGLFVLFIEKTDDGKWMCICFNEDILDTDLTVVEKFLYDRMFNDGELCL